MDRQKKLHHHHVTGRECGGTRRGLAGLPWAAAEVAEGYFSGRGLSPEKCGVQPQAGLPNLQHQNQEPK